MFRPHRADSRHSLRSTARLRCNGGLHPKTLSRRALCQGLVSAAFGNSVGRSLAITLDDFDVSRSSPLAPKAANRALLDTLDKHGLQAALFVAAKNIADADRRKLLSEWRDAGHLIGNHTFSHVPIDSMDLPAFERDVLRADATLREFLAPQRLFRFPMLKEGATIENRDGMRAFLEAHGYRNGHVTIDTSDWYFDARLRQRLAQDPRFDVERFREPYLAHVAARSDFYAALSQTVLHREIPHTILLHYTYLNARFLGDLLAMFRRNGWRLAPAARAFSDPVFRSQPATLPAGESLVWALAKESGCCESQLRYPGEDDVYEKPALDRLGL